MRKRKLIGAFDTSDSSNYEAPIWWVNRGYMRELDDARTVYARRYGARYGLFYSGVSPGWCSPFHYCKKRPYWASSKGFPV